MDFINPLANEYAEKYSQATPSYLKELFEHTRDHHPHAHLQSNWQQGGFLSFISKLIQPSTILEIGSFTGFSSLCLAEGISQNGELHTIELREVDAYTAQNNFTKSPKCSQIKMHIGDAKTIIPSLDFQWDLVFIDADKVGYIDYYELILPRLAPKGLMIVDNTLFHGDVLVTPIQGKSAKAIQAFNEHVYNDSRTEQSLLTIRDGLTLIRKI